MHVASDDSIEPYGAIVAHFHVAHYDCAFAEVAVLAESGSRHPLESFYDSHLVLLNINH
jgi:hypothetical protein